MVNVYCYVIMLYHRFSPLLCVVNFLLKDSQDPDVWDNIRKLAAEERKTQSQKKPPLKMHGKKNIPHGGARPRAGRKKSKPKVQLL